jgi:hypothetical protein
MCNGGGSGGGGGSQNPDTRYANLDQLYGTQNQASQFMLNNAMPWVPQITQNSATMAQQAMDGTLGRQMRDQAGNNAQASFGSALDANNRNMQRFGMGMNANRIMSENNRNAIMGAGMKAGEMNKANNAAEDMKWNRNANFYGQVMGMNNGAMAGMSSAGAGMANTAGQMSANDMANAKGYGQAGAAFSSALFKADGGYINAPKLAEGGDAWAAYKAAISIKPMSSSGGGKRGNAFSQMLGGAAPQLLGAGLKDVMKGKDGKIYGLAKDGYSKLNSAPVSEAGSSLGDMVPAVEYVETVPDLTALGATEVGTQVGTEVGTQVGAEVGTQAATEAGVQAGAEIGASAAPSVFESVGGILAMAKGGAVKKPGLCLALGGMANSSVAQANQVDGNASVAKMDASDAMAVSKMDDAPKTKSGMAETHAKPVVDTQYSGKTDGMGESSDGDPDGFGSKGADNRHMMGSSSLSLAGNMMGGTIGGAVGKVLGEVLHPVGEAVSRTLVTTGDKLGGVSGAMMYDPIGTMASGKYSPSELWKGSSAVVLGMPWAGKVFNLADGGRVDHTNGGEVDGPGSETSDDIPAWLSDGEYVLNAEAVKMVGKKKLDKINKAGLAKRGDKPGLEMASDGGIKAAMGGNIGVAMGAGVDQWNRQQMLDQRDKEMELRQAQDARQQEQFNWQRQQHEAALLKQAKIEAAQAGSLESVSNATAMAGLPSQLKARVAAGEITQEEANNALRAYNTSGYTPESLSKKAGLQLAQVDLGKGLELQKVLGNQLKAEKMDRVGRHLAAGDYAGLADVMSNNEFNPDGKGYKFLGTDKKDGNEYVRFGVAGADGRMVEQSVDKRVLPGLVEASLDPTKGIEYTREVGKITDKDRDNRRADQQLGISAGHLGLSQSKFNLEKSTLELEAKAKKEVTDLRRKLSDTDDDAERAKINRRIADLSGAASGGGQIKVLKGEAGDADVAVYTDKQGNSYRIDPKNLPLKDQPGGAAPTKTVSKSDADAEWNSRGKDKFKSRADFDASLAAKGYVVK